MCDIHVPYGQFSFPPWWFALGLNTASPRFTTPHRAPSLLPGALGARSGPVDRHPVVHTVTVTDRDIRAVQNPLDGAGAKWKGNCSARTRTPRLPDLL
ncbi:hypothetical protein GA0115259_1034129 [Streptomyces sp. MnatMP-M17]|nr:hypothetical protein GA0115259_1034129 [Streptomyces sp. MnatMP-M17]